ncbi:MAG: DNA polymerase III subunit beta [Phycisphaerae bacterium]|nr:DNA polymerase III subunit beta [Phycisphaerae bacterium]
MKATGKREALSEGFQLASSVAAHRSPKPALACVKIEATAKGFTILATDMEAGIRFGVAGVDVAEPGEALIPADRINAILRELKDDEVTISSEAEAAIIETVAGGKSGARFKILGEEPADFPPIPEFKPDGAFSVDIAVLKTMIGRTLFATARESTRYALNGVLVEVEGAKINMVATDGRRLAMARGQCKPAGKSEKRSAIIPAKAVSLIERCIAGDGAADLAVQISLTEKEIMVRSPEVDGKVWEIYSRLVEGHFPKYEDVIPKDKDLDKHATLGKEEFHAAVRKAALLTTEEARSIKLQFKSEELTLSSQAPEMGEATVRMPAAYDGKEIEIGFNPQFLADALKIIETEEIIFAFQGPNQPGMISVGKEFIYVVMPVSIV